MSRSSVLLVIALAVVFVSPPAGLQGRQSDHIIGFVTQGDLVNTTQLAIRRPPIRSGKVTAAGSQFDASGSWTETGFRYKPFTYSVTVKSSGGWSASTKQMKESLVLTLAGYDSVTDGTWQFSSTATCAQDPWRFKVTCAGLKLAVSRPTGGSTSSLRAAVPYPLSAAGRLTAAEVSFVSLAEVVMPQMNESVPNDTNVAVKIQVHPATLADNVGTLHFYVRPNGSPDFPTAATQKQYLSKSMPGVSPGNLVQTNFDLSGLGNIDWQVAGTFMKSASGTRSDWVRFNTKKKVLSSPAGIVNIEGEALTASASGPVTAQPMQTFGSGWSEGTQLYWGATSVGATLTVTFDVPVAGTYSAELYMTRAPDFGNVEVVLSGLQPFLTFSGFAPKVMPSGPIQMGKFPLKAGPNTLRFRVTGRYQDSKGYRVGLDRIRLYPG